MLTKCPGFFAEALWKMTRERRDTEQRQQELRLSDVYLDGLSTHDTDNGNVRQTIHDYIGNMYAQI